MYKVLHLPSDLIEFEGSFDECHDWVAKRHDYYNYTVVPYDS